MNIRFSVKADIDGLSKLWDLCFPDDEEFKQYYLTNIFQPELTLVIEEGGDIIAMTHALIMEMNYHSSIIPSAYIYAVGTHPSYRGRGLAAQMMTRILEELHTRKIPVAFLVPQTAALFKYYEKFGFADVFKIGPKVLRRKDYQVESVNTGIVLCKPTPKEVAEASDVFNGVMRYRNHLTRTPDHWRIAAEIAELAGGGMFAVKNDGVLTGYAFAEVQEDTVKIYELMANDEESYNMLCAGVLDKMNTDSALMHGPACPHDTVPLGMARVVDAQFMIEQAANYRRDMECTFVVRDEEAPWNTGKYEILAKDVTRTEPKNETAFITPLQLTDVLFGAGPLPYINLLFN